MRRKEIHASRSCIASPEFGRTSERVHSRCLSLIQPNIPPLFDRLPAGLFRALGVETGRHYSEVSARLTGELWSAIHPSSYLAINTSYRHLIRKSSHAIHRTAYGQKRPFVAACAIQFFAHPYYQPQICQP